MAAVANIVLQDAQATPVSHTFIPLGPDKNGVWWWQDQSASNVISYPLISLSFSRPAAPSDGANSGGRTYRIKTGVHLPVAETLGTNDAGVTPPPTLAFTLRKYDEYVMSERASLQNRKDLRKYGMNLQADTQVVACVESLQPPF